jgi:hypothetical protein
MAHLVVVVVVVVDYSYSPWHTSNGEEIVFSLLDFTFKKYRHRTFFLEAARDGAHSKDPTSRARAASRPQHIYV